MTNGRPTLFLYGVLCCLHN